jgi:hypothetical protein
MMRAILTICAVALCLSGALAAGGTARQLDRRANLKASALKLVRAGLAPAVRKSLAGTITRDQQVMMLRSEPKMAQRLEKFGATATPLPATLGSWDTGITLTPLLAGYPLGATSQNYELSLDSEAVWLCGQGVPLPNPTQDPPLLWFSVPWETNQCLFTLWARWPQPGAYMITFFLRNVWDTAAKPRLCDRVHHETMLTPIPNKPTCAERWTILWDASDPNAQYQAIDVYPSEDTVNFAACCLSKIVVTRVTQ